MTEASDKNPSRPGVGAAWVEDPLMAPASS
jgi:hypothetical protein